MFTPRREMMPGGGGIGVVVDGFFIRRSASPLGPTSRRPLYSPTDNKENLHAYFNNRRRRSPLPDWYPRTPLRDITVIVNALNRRRLRLAASQRRSPGNESTPQPHGVLPQEATATDHQPEPGDNPDQAASADNLCHNCEPSSHLPTGSTPSSTTADFPKVISSTSSCSHPPEHSADIVLPPTDSATDASKSAEPVKNLLISLDEIEKAVMDNMKRISKGPAKKAARTKTLLSMR